uniref:Uncharacterized protein n=1 Tax=Poecilia formosa TaxID=48698 RepID=A0A096LXW1_POEFO
MTYKNMKYISELLKHLSWKPGFPGSQKNLYLGELQTVQIMVGVLNIGLGPGRTSTRLGDFTSLGAAYWLGAVFVVTGIMTVLAGRFPSSCLVGFTVFLNIVGAIFSITGIVFYAIDLNNSSLLWVCDRSGSDPDRYDDSCRNMAAFDQNLLTSLDKALILLAVLLLVVSISFAALGIGFLTGEVKEEEVKYYGPIMQNSHFACLYA